VGSLNMHASTLSFKTDVKCQNIVGLNVSKTADN